ATVRTGVSAGRATSAPDLRLPDGRVRVASELPGAPSGGLATLAFGGNGALQSDARRWTWEPAAELELFAPGAAAHRVTPAGTVRGGVGAFRSLLDPHVIAGPSAATGLPGGLTRLACLGAAVPTPDWSAFAHDLASVPDRCAGGADGVLRDTAPDVQLLDP